MSRITDPKRRSPRSPHGKSQVPVKRSACEECRNRKLGCTKTKSGCERCTTEGLSCRFENRLRMGRPCKPRPRTPTTPPTAPPTSHSRLLHTPVKRESAPRDTPFAWKSDEIMGGSLPLSPAQSQQGEPFAMSGRMSHTLASSPMVIYDGSIQTYFYTADVPPGGHMSTGPPVGSQYFMMPEYQVGTAPVDQRASSCSYGEEFPSQRGCSCTERIAEPAMYRLLKAKVEGAGLKEAWRGVAGDLAQMKACAVCFLADHGRGTLEYQWLVNKERELGVTVEYCG